MSAPADRPEIDPALLPYAVFIEERIPFNAHLGVVCDRLQRGEAVMRVPWQEHLTGDPFRPAVHGGVISALLDNAGGLACFTTFDRKTQRCSTIDLRVDYLGPGPTGADLICRARVIRRGKRVIFTRMEAWSGSVPGPDEDRPPFAIGQATYSLFDSGAPTFGFDDGVD